MRVASNKKIKDLPKIERPREKLIQYGQDAAQVILAHNHPSGDTEPSEDDLEINKRLVDAGKILGIEVVNHIIVCKSSYLSFKEKGLL